MSRVKRFYQNIQAIEEERYQRVCNEGMISDFCWVLYRDDPTDACKRKSFAKHFKIFILTLCGPTNRLGCKNNLCCLVQTHVTHAFSLLPF